MARSALARAQRYGESHACDGIFTARPSADQRKFGYYTLPILWGDRLVARFDSKLDRATGTFIIMGLWLDDPRLAKDEAFAEALARGFGRFVPFLGASNLDTKAIREPLLRRRVNKFVSESLGS